MADHDAPTVTGQCDSCGREGEELTAVHRMYVVPETWDTPGSQTTLTDVELWCFACRSHYPHEVAEG
jgi:hypothetical protein